MSVAYKTNTAFDYPQPEARREEPKPAQAKRPVPRSAVMLRRVLLFFVAVFAAGVCIGLIYVKSQVFLAQREVNQTRREIKEAERLNSNLSEQLNEAVSINVIMEKAAALGMGYADEGHILYVNADGAATGIEMKTGE